MNLFVKTGFKIRLWIKNNLESLASILVALACLLLSLIPYSSDLELAAKTQSEVINAQLTQQWHWQPLIELPATKLELQNITLNQDPFINDWVESETPTHPITQGNLVITKQDTSQLTLSSLQVAATSTVHLSKQPHAGYRLTITKRNSNQSRLLSGKLLLVGPAEVCQNPLNQSPLNATANCTEITPSRLRPDIPKSIHFTSHADSFSIMLPPFDGNLFQSTPIERVRFWRQDIAQDFTSSPFRCALTDGVLIFTVQQQSLELWRTDCIEIWGSSLQVSTQIDQHAIQSQIRGYGQANSQVMPSVLQAKLVNPTISDIATLIGWILLLIPFLWTLLTSVASRETNAPD
ncbi:MAG: hypothetical protein MI808_16820 [Pseudomonadales bacterium]|nr:hypothetical protein [Pseudomonadales bacterium]